MIKMDSMIIYTMYIISEVQYSGTISMYKRFGFLL